MDGVPAKCSFVAVTGSLKAEPLAGRYIDGLARTTDRLPSFGQRRILRQIQDVRDMTHRTANTFRVTMMELLVLTDIGFV